MALVSLALIFLSTPAAFGQSMEVDYLCEIGKIYYVQGKTNEALSEFNKVLSIDPDNRQAKDYINKIFNGELRKEDFRKKDDPVRIKPAAPVALSVKNSPVNTAAVPERQIAAKDVVVPETAKKNETQKKETAMEQALNNLKSPEPVWIPPYDPSRAGSNAGWENEKKDGIKAGPLRITGQVQLSFGVTPDDFVWKRANFDLNEKFLSWRMTSHDAFNRGFNTYDPAIYDSLSINLDTENEQGFNFHTNITVDPWSYVGKSSKVTVTGFNTDPAEIQMYYWSNTGYTVNRTIYTLLGGDSINIPELKVEDGSTSPTTIVSNRYGTTFNIPAMKIKYEFQPLRELWLDYANDQIKFRAFPMAYQDQAYTSDDPLNISNHGIWWKDSMWLRNYVPGNYNSGDFPVSFTKGGWDDSLSFIAKDSNGRYLTALRGFSFSFQPEEATVFDTTVATPKNLWQDYGVMDNLITASRLKHHFSDNFVLGGTFTSRMGYTTNPQKLDSQNFVGGVDMGYEVSDGLLAQAEILTSKSNYDMTNSTYETESRGNAYYFSFITRYPQKSIMDLKYGYEEIGPDKDENFLVKSKFYASRMDRGFDSALSDFHNTRQDVFWSRHIHFRKPMDYYSQGLNGSTTNWGELNATRIGDGIDVGRSTLGFRIETFLNEKFYNLFDIRNVHDVNGKFVENVVRDEATIKITDKLTAKALGIYQKMPKTVGGIDPYIYDGATGEFFQNDAVPDGEDPSIKTGSFGLNYDFFEWLSLNGIYERTNDYTLAYGNFPQNALRNDTTLNSYYYQYGNCYRYVWPYLYNQSIFPQAPYDFYNVFKTGLRIVPMKNMEIYLDYTRNEYETASLINDNMNHIGMEITYMPTEKMGMSFKYIYSRCKDIIYDGSNYGLTDNVVGHHNFFTEFRYMPSKDDEFSIQYGVGDTSSLGNISSLDPYGGSMLTLDTQHIIRAYYRRKF
ncbi:MAG: tetratricopeptide repeat protein [Candidatus Omnitrophica bacterium]|nr:tetratricopeptide repeat protein [Candidatus Omnitrophota bacterium]